MAKASIVEARRAQAAQMQAADVAALREQLDRVEAKFDQVLAREVDLATVVATVDLDGIQQAVADGIAAALPKK